MIKINLLPFRAARKRENIKRQIGFYVIVVIIVLVVIGTYSMKLNDQLNDLKNDERKIKKELASYKKELAEIKKLDKKIIEVKKKLSVIKGLEKGKTGPVLLLSDLADAVPENKLWIKSFSEKKGSLSLSGTAMDNETVALFMNNLKNTKSISSVDLKSAVRRTIKQYNLKVSDFVLSCKTYAEEKEKPKKKSKAKRKPRKGK